MKKTDSARPWAAGATLVDEDKALARYFADAPNRLVAFLIDAVVLSILAFAGAIVISVALGPVVTFDPEAEPIVQINTALALVDVALTMAISAAYFIGSWLRFGASPGQLMLALRVSRANEDRRVSPGQGFVRWLFIGLPLGLEGLASIALAGRADVLLLVLVATWYVVLLFSIARHPRKQGWHDRLAKTVVTKLGRPVGTMGTLEQHVQ